MAPTMQHLSRKVPRIYVPLRCFSSFSVMYENDEEPPPLVEFEAARLGYPPVIKDPIRTHLSHPIDLKIRNPTFGGHILLGRNGVGKSLVSNAVRTKGEDYLREGKFHSERTTMIQHVSFESHEDLLAQNVTAYKAIADGNLSKAAQFLVVRFGLFPLLHRDVTTLSTGEIRKVMLIRALARRPKLLVLDNAFDGLDIPSRETLSDLVSKTLKGFRPDILVQSVSAKATAHTQVLMVTHRAEEIVPEISTVSSFQSDGRLETTNRVNQAGIDLLMDALNVCGEDSWSMDPWKDPTLGLPSMDDISNWWTTGERKVFAESTLVQAKNLTIQRGDSTLIQNMNWSVEKGQSWLIAGHNGSGKSTLSRLLACIEVGITNGSLMILGDSAGAADRVGERRPCIGWVSTESHIASSRLTKSVVDVLTSDGIIPLELAMPVAEWCGMVDAVKLASPFSHLSQGEQKLILIATAIASRPQVLILDEPCQGLDLVNRRRVLGLVERVCQATGMSLIYVTHHLDELVPTISHVLHLTGGQDVYNGERQGYDPSVIHDV